MNSLLYVSRRKGDSDRRMRDVDDILSVARSRNASLGVTGALVATCEYYAQIVEGETAAIDEVMASISRDERHSGLMIAPLETKPRRDFDGWTLAYQGESTYVAGLVAAAIKAPEFELPAHAANIRSLIAMLA